ncbi:MAG TPA: LysR substrate-binding domain-containing protein [Xanthobacteraceae bacterium]|nr:LysR substrate-binding domain-containing protein [Xanthobacteraceae bacterium]
MDLSDLRIFTAVVREGSVTGAARRLHRVQSNVTTRIRQLEADLGVALFIREGKRLHLAPAGQVLLDYADRLLALSDEAREAVQSPEPRGAFRLGAMESTAAVRLPEVLSQYHRRYPEVAIELRTGNPQTLANAILAGELDAAFVTEPVADELFEKTPAFEEELVIIASADHPAIARKAGLPRNMIAFERGCPHRKRLEDWYARRGAMPERTIELASYHAMLGCAVAGMGAALLPMSVLTTFPERKRLSIHRLPRGEDRLMTVLIWRKRADSPKIQALSHMLLAPSPR